MPNGHIIVVREIFPSTHSFRARDQARKLYAIGKDCFLDKGLSFEFDFREIDFVSRSFADELVSLISSTAKRNLIGFRSTMQTVEDMFAGVLDTRRGNARMEFAYHR